MLVSRAGMPPAGGGAGQHTAEELRLQAHVIEGVDGLIVVGLDEPCGTCWLASRTHSRSARSDIRQGGRGLAGAGSDEGSGRGALSLVSQPARRPRWPGEIRGSGRRRRTYPRQHPQDPGCSPYLRYEVKIWTTG